MSAQCSVFIATSLDGYIARDDGSLDWLDRANSVVPAGEDCGYQTFMATVDALVMGRNTFETVLAFPEWPFGSTPAVVMSRRGIAVPGNVPPTVSVSSEAPADLVARLSGQGARRLYIDGGVTIQGFLAAGLIDDITITVVPVLLGSGRRLFGPLPGDVRLIHERSHAWDFGFVQHTYRVDQGA